MKILISQNISIIKSYKEKINYLSYEWTDFFAKNRPDIKLLAIPNNPKIINEYYKYFNPDGLILSNGNDIGEFSEREKTESILVRKFIAEKKPILGTCRGHQFLNYYFNGHLPKRLKDNLKKNHRNNNHSIEICDKKFNFLNQKKIVVNSYHNFGIFKKNLSKNFKVFAIGEEDIVEGIFDKKRNIYGIQWHIERKSPSKKFNLRLLNEIFKKK